MTEGRKKNREEVERLNFHQDGHPHHHKLRNDEETTTCMWETSHIPSEADMHICCKFSETQKHPELTHLHGRLEPEGTCEHRNKDKE